MAQERINNLQASELIEGALKTMRNAQQLCDESELLHQHKIFARSHALSHLAREEIGKSIMLYRTTIERILDHKIDWKKIDKRFRDHKEKILNDRAFTYFLYGSMEIEGNKLDPKILFNSGTIAYTNARKNSSLYVDWTDGKFKSPEESVSEDQSARNLEIAMYRASLMSKVIQSLFELAEKPKEELAKIFPIEEIMQHAQRQQDAIKA